MGNDETLYGSMSLFISDRVGAGLAPALAHHSKVSKVSIIEILFYVKGFF